MEEKTFQSLLPQSGVDLHSYEDALNYAMNDDKIRNIALSGSYGSGKSSIINSYENRCTVEAKNLRQYLPDKKFELVCTTNKKPKFSGTEDVRIILEYFKTQGWISSYQLLPSGEYQAFSKQRKLINK